MKKVYVVADYHMFGHGLVDLLQHASGDLTILGSGTTLDQALEQLKILQVDTIILYSRQPEKEGLKLWLHLLENDLRATIISLSVDNNKMYLPQLALRNIESLEDLMQAIAGSEEAGLRDTEKADSLLATAPSDHASAPSLLDLLPPIPNFLHHAWVSSRPER